MLLARRSAALAGTASVACAYLCCATALCGVFWHGTPNRALRGIKSTARHNDASVAKNNGKKHGENKRRDIEWSLTSCWRFSMAGVTPRVSARRGSALLLSNALNGEIGQRKSSA